MGLPIDNRVIWTILSSLKEKIIEAALMFVIVVFSLGAAVLVFMYSIKAAATNAGTAHVTADTSYTMSETGLTFQVVAGSSYASLAMGTRTFTLTLGEGDTTILRRPETSRGKFSNNIGLDECRYVNGTNTIWVNGPNTVTFELTGHTCDSSDTSKVYDIGLSTPSAGTSFAEGDSELLLWQNRGDSPASITLRLSSDGGFTYPTVIAEALISNGFYIWTVPLVATTATARLLIEGVENGRVVALGVSELFSIQGIDPPPPPEPFTPADETSAASTIGTDLGLEAYEEGTGQSVCVPETRIKGASSSAVYYCGPDGKRHAFPNQRIHDTWYGSFAGVIELSDEDLAKVQLGANVRYRPGVRMIKLQTDPKVYAVGMGGELRWVQTEAVAIALYGDDWNTQIDDVSDAFFADYTVGDAITEETLGA